MYDPDAYMASLYASVMVSNTGALTTPSVCFSRLRILALFPPLGAANATDESRARDYYRCNIWGKSS